MYETSKRICRLAFEEALCSLQEEPHVTQLFEFCACHRFSSSISHHILIDARLNSNSEKRYAIDHHHIVLRIIKITGSVQYDF